GVLRSDDHGHTWRSIAKGLPSDFGFPIVVHPHDADTVYVVPLAGMTRTCPDGAPAVWRSENGGDSWQRLAGVNPAFVLLSPFRDSSRLSSLREVAIVLCRRDCSPHIPSQGTALNDRGQLGPATEPARCGRIWCEFLTVRATPPKATCCW